MADTMTQKSMGKSTKIVGCVLGRENEKRRSERTTIVDHLSGSRSTLVGHAVLLLCLGRRYLV